MKGGLSTRYQVAKAHTQRLGFAGRFKHGNSRGFTIVEVMVVLVVTGALFASAATLISGRQNKTQFTIAINDTKAQMQQFISDVSTGFYPSTNDINCSLDAATSTPKFTAGTNTQGTNQDCTFMGKAVEFGVTSTTPEQFWVFSLAGLRQKTVAGVSSDVQTIAEASPKVMAVNLANPNGSATAQRNLQNGLTTGKMTYTNAGVTKDIVAIAFVSDLGQNSTGLVSGAQAVNIVPIVSTGGQSVPNTSPASTATSINANIATAPVNPDGGVSVCFVSGTTNQTGILTIGGSNQRQNSVTLSIRSTKTCP